jgi:hypothetical protein
MTDYRPSPQLADALAAYTAAQEAAEDRRVALRAAVAAELIAYSDLTNELLAEHLPWSGETVRGIAREYEIPPKRKPTVRSIKPQKRRTTA